jgi:uncharacterized protein (DUF924 family)
MAARVSRRQVREHEQRRRRSFVLVWVTCWSETSRGKLALVILLDQLARNVHRDIILRYGRFPHRNAVLGRNSTATELAFLKAEAVRPGPLAGGERELSSRPCLDDHAATGDGRSCGAFS